MVPDTALPLCLYLGPVYVYIEWERQRSQKKKRDGGSFGLVAGVYLFSTRCTAELVVIILESRAGFQVLVEYVCM